jgi:hypothetical protein
MIVPNTTCDIYRVGNAPPSAPDVAGVPLFITYCYDIGRERGEKEAQQFRFTAIANVDLTADIRDDFSDWTGSATNRDTIYVPDKTGIGYKVIFVETIGRNTPQQRRRVYLDRMTVTWPWPPATSGNQTWNIAGTYSWTCPAGVTSVTAECWGSGGDGSGNPSAGAGGGGGGGGYSRRNTVPVTPGTTYTVVVAAAGNAGTSHVTGDSSVECLANSGTSSISGGANGAGGSVTGALGDVVFAGGNGGSPAMAGGGGGGSSAGPSANGNNGVGETGGAAVSGGGAGGNGSELSPSSPGSSPGGGGGGNYASTPANGADGQVTLSW